MQDVVDRLNRALQGRYAIESKIGEGGMATVFLADDRKHERRVALKVLRPELAAVMGAERFLAEIKTTANLQHPHILPLFDSGEADGFLFYVMPYVEGESLRDRLRRDVQLGVDEAVRIARAVAGALQVAHDAGIIHRDIKPENILLSRGEPLVSDFGIALAVSQAGGGRLTETGLSLGTPYYMSPEQAAADRDPGRASDVYSLGCVLYEMLVGDPPHTGSSAQAVLAKILTEEPRPVTAVRKTVPLHVADTVARALERLPADRFESADAFSRALGDPGFRHGTALAAAAAPPEARSAVRTSAVLPWALATLAAVAAVAGWMRGTARTSDGPTELWMDAGTDWLSRYAEVAVSPDGRTFALAWRDEGDDHPPLWVRTADHAAWRPLAGTEGGRNPAFSPDGRRIAYVMGDELMSVSVAGGSPLTLYQSENRLDNPHWGASGDVVVAASSDGILRIRSDGSVDSLRIEGFVGRPYALPDGSAVLYTQEARRGEASIRIQDFRGGSSRVLVQEGERPIYLESGHILFAHPEGGLQVVPFDLARAEVTGPPVPVLDGVVPWGFALSGTGTLVYRTGLTTARVWQRLFLLVGLDGSVDTLGSLGQNPYGVRVSPDGERLVFGAGATEVSQSQIYIYDLVRRTGPTQLTFEGENASPIWSPDGTRVAYQHDGTSVVAKAVDGGSPAVSLFEDSVLVTPTDWTGGDELVLERMTGADRDLIRLTTDGTKGSEDLLHTAYREFGAEVSPDRRWFAYVSNEVGNDNQVFVRAYPSALGPWNVSRGGAWRPRWSPDGRSLFFQRSDPSTLTRVDVALEPTFVVSDPVDVFSGLVSAFDVFPDGRRLVVIDNRREETGREASRIVVVLNWFDVIRERLDAAGGR